MNHTKITKILGFIMVLNSTIFFDIKEVKAIDLKANFHLFGEVNRFGIGYGDIALHFGVNSPPLKLEAWDIFLEVYRLHREYLVPLVSPGRASLL